MLSSDISRVYPMPQHYPSTPPARVPAAKSRPLAFSAAIASGRRPTALRPKSSRDLPLEDAELESALVGATASTVATQRSAGALTLMMLEMSHPRATSMHT